MVAKRDHDPGILLIAPHNPRHNYGFFVLTTAPTTGFGTFFLPIQFGAREMAFPSLSRLGFWITCASFGVLLSTFFVSDGPPISGWTAYPPLSALGSDAGPGEALGQTLWTVSLGLFCIAQVLTAINFITTTLDLRAKGMTLARLPITVWTWFVTAVMMLIGFLCFSRQLLCYCSTA